LAGLRYFAPLALKNLGFVGSPLGGSRTTADFARLDFVRATLRFLLKRGT